MKLLLVLLFTIFWGLKTDAQLLKKLGNRIKNNAEWRVESKADQQVNKVIDSLLLAPKKNISKPPSGTRTPENSPAENNTNNSNALKKNTTIPSANITTTAADQNDMTPKDSYVTLNISASTVFAGGNILISGESVNYKNFNQVEITVNGPSVKDVKQVLLKEDGKYTSGWYANGKAGEYTITVKASDKKGMQSAKFTVYELPMLSNMCDENIDATKKAIDKLKEQVEEVKNNIGSTDKTGLEKNFDAVKEKADDLLKLYKDLNTAGKEISNLAKSGKKLSPNLTDNLSELNNVLAGQQKKMKQIEEYNDHQPADNTICEYLVMLNEACAAFSVYTNVESRVIATIINNIGLDKGIPKIASMVNERFKGLSEPNDFAIKEPAKIYATSLVDAESLTTKLGIASFAGDLVQFATDVLMKKYCGVFKGNFNHNYTIAFRNKNGQNWWTYGVEMKAALSLRYPKDKNKGNIIKMKGNIEGNATKFSFFQDIEKDDGFQDGGKGNIKVIPIKTFTPLAVSVATSERDVLGFGAIARGMATPAYFNIPVDAEYDVNANKIKLFVNAAIIDFSIYVYNDFVFLLVGPDMLPYIKHMVFPIHPARLTINSVVKDHNEFDVTKDAKGNLSFTGKANKHIGDKSSERETDLNFTITAKKE